MHNARFKLMAGLAGATLCLFAVTSYAQNPTTQTVPPTGSAGTGVDAQTTPQGTTTPATPQATPTDAATAPTATDATTTTTWSFPGGALGILAAVVLVFLLLFAVFRGRDRTVIRETYASSSTTAPGARNVGTGSTVDDRGNVVPRAASGPGTTGGMNDPNARR